MLTLQLVTAVLLGVTLLADGGSVRCCPPGAVPGKDGAGAGRCLERLTRGKDADPVTAACAATVGSELFAARSGQQPTCRPGAQNFFGLNVDDWVSQGWWQDGPPNFPYEHQHYHLDRMAIGSKACDTPQWASAREHCKAGFEAVHLYVALSPDASATFAKKTSEVDPWSGDASLRKNVVFASLSDFGKIQELVNGLVSDCKIVRFALFSSHGTPGQIYIGYEGKKGHRSVTSFVREVISPCALAPAAKMQFDGCLFSCGNLAEPMRRGFERALTAGDYSTPANPKPLEGVQILVSTGLMRDRIYDKSRYFFFGPEIRHTEVLPENGEGLVYTLHGQSVDTDEPTSSVADCPSQYKTSQKAIDAVSRAE